MIPPHTTPTASLGAVPERHDHLTLADVFAMWAGDRERLCTHLEGLLARAEREPLEVDVSDFSDEFCEGFLRGQMNVLELLLREPPLPDRTAS